MPLTRAGSGTDKGPFDVVPALLGVEAHLGRGVAGADHRLPGHRRLGEGLGQEEGLVEAPVFNAFRVQGHGRPGDRRPPPTPGRGGACSQCCITGRKAIWRENLKPVMAWAHGADRKGPRPGPGRRGAGPSGTPRRGGRRRPGSANIIPQQVHRGLSTHVIWASHSGQTATAAASPTGTPQNRHIRGRKNSRRVAPNCLSRNVGPDKGICR